MWFLKLVLLVPPKGSRADLGGFRIDWESADHGSFTKSATRGHTHGHPQDNTGRCHRHTVPKHNVHLAVSSGKSRLYYRVNFETAEPLVPLPIYVRVRPDSFSVCNNSMIRVVSFFPGRVEEKTEFCSLTDRDQKAEGSFDQAPLV